jgi:glycosyltransferase involved in cell wall biosynthesis
MAPEVSVIVGTFNCARFLPGLWACLDAQTFRNFEIVVVDDASTDGKTLAALEARGDRIRLIRRPANSGTCELPRYQGVRAAQAPLCAFLDADDRWDPEFLERCVAHLRAHPAEAFVHTTVRVIDGADRVLRIRHEGAMPIGAALPRALLEHCYVTISAVVARKDVWLAAIPEDALGDFGMDQDIFLRIVRRHPAGFIPEVLASYRRSEASVSVKKWRRFPRNVHTLERIARNRLWEGLVPKAEMNRILRDAYLENAEHWRRAGAPRRALWFCGRGLLRRPRDGKLWKTVAGILVRGR